MCLDGGGGCRYDTFVTHVHRCDILLCTCVVLEVLMEATVVQEMKALGFDLMEGHI